MLPSVYKLHETHVAITARIDSVIASLRGSHGQPHPPFRLCGVEKTSQQVEEWL